MKLVPTLTAVVTCLSAYTSAALATEVASEAATESADPSLSGILPAEQGSTKGNGNEASSDEIVSGKSSSKSHGREAKNAIYADLLGPGLFYSLNYDRVLTDDLSARIGFSYLSLGVSASDGAGTSVSESFSYWAVPLTVSYLGIGSPDNMFEVGGGGVLMHVKGQGLVDAQGENVDAEGNLDSMLMGMTALAGYRHQPADGGFVFRVGVSPLMVFGSGFLPWGYLSLGAAF
jgi:hypothetical protein